MVTDTLGRVDRDILDMNISMPTVVALPCYVVRVCDVECVPYVGIQRPATEATNVVLLVVWCQKPTPERVDSQTRVHVRRCNVSLLHGRVCHTIRKPKHPACAV
jgi:hypothetical protein